MKVSRAVVVTLGVLPLLSPVEAGARAARQLNLAERLAAQRAIERVYASHQITSVPIGAVPDAIVATKVRQALKRSVALERFWGVTIDATMLRRETERMRRDSRMPERLREIEAALGDDSVLIQESLVRPALTARLAHRFFASDSRIHAPARGAVDDLRQRLAEGSIDSRADRAGRQVYRFRPLDGDPQIRLEAGRAPIHVPGDPIEREVDAEEFARWNAGLPAGVGLPSPVQETPDAFLIDVPLVRRGDRIDAARYTIPKMTWDEWWAGVAPGLDESGVTTVAEGYDAPPIVVGPECESDTWDTFPIHRAPDARNDHAAVWTGSEVIVWGGYDVALDRVNTGGRYDPALDTWSPTSLVDAPTPRARPLAVWTGDRMLVWGGENRIAIGTGASYDPGTDTWTPMSLVGAPAPRAGAAAVWTGSRMLVWGGYAGSAPTNTGAAYDPVTETWSTLTASNAPAGRYSHTAVWTGARMVVWGGYDNLGNPLGTGGRYDPLTDSWAPTSTAGPSSRVSHTAVWSGTRMIVWGGADINGAALNSGGLYDPVLDAWTPMSDVNLPSPRSSHSAVWSGTEMIVWGGGASLNTGARYHPASNVWVPVSTVNAPPGRTFHTAVWAGYQMIVWGGRGNLSYEPSLNSGGRYDPAVNRWTPTFTGDVPYARSAHSLVWTGTLMVVWGGAYAGGFLDAYLATGGRYDPALDLWEPTSLSGAPTGRTGHSTVWTGSRMIIWGGGAFGYANSGALYDPVGDTWSPVSSVNAPTARGNHAAVWTGQLMLIWGGFSPAALNTGARYNPALNQWTVMSTLGAPSPRSAPAVWTGERMIVWSGTGDSTGGQYDVATDSWTPTSTLQAPLRRAAHSSVWTGSRMIVWGGRFNSTALDDGSRYDPVADVWSPISSAGAPSAREGHAAVWTGSEMLVWGGSGCSSGCYASQGGRYDPDADAWTAMSASGAPSGLAPAAWAGSRMLLWGVYVRDRLGGTGYSYCECIARTWFRDFDADGLGSPFVTTEACAQPAGFVMTAGDCNDSAADAWGTPGEARDLKMTGGDTFIWNAPWEPGGDPLSYDLLRSAAPADFGGADACVATGVPGTTASDPELPPIGGVHYYVVRAISDCPDSVAEGPVGWASDGTPRAARSCP